MHDDEPRAARRADAGHGRICSESGDVIHDRGTRAQGGVGDAGLDRVDRDRNGRPALVNRPDRGLDAPPLFGFGDTGGAGPGGLTPDIDDVGAVCHQTLGLREGRRRRKKLPPSLKLSGVTLMIPTITGRSSGTPPPRTRQLIA